jgi:hypothetical protein
MTDNPTEPITQDARDRLERLAAASTRSRWTATRRAARLATLVPDEITDPNTQGGA